MGEKDLEGRAKLDTAARGGKATEGWKSWKNVQGRARAPAPSPDPEEPQVSDEA